MEEKVFNAVLVATTIDLNKEDLFIVWSCYILGNRKFLIGAKNTEAYFEVTYNREKDEWYVDEYTKINNVLIKNDILESYTKNN